MRHAFWLLTLGIALAGCQCSPDVPTAVTLRLKNTSREPLFVDDSDGRLGLVVQRNVGGQWLSFVEEPRCACQACDRVCQGCSCDAGTPSLVRKVGANEVRERTWKGVVQVSGIGRCSTGGSPPPCLFPENPPVEETFRLHFCYSPSAPGVAEADGGQAVPGTLPTKSVLCVDREFRPADGVAEVSPLKGAECADHAQCQGTDELCFGGSCTPSCPANDFPEIGASWQVRIPEPDDQGFFALTTEGTRKTYRGTGTATSVSYQNNTMQVRLSRTGAAGEALNGALYVTLPPGYALPLAPGTKVAVKLIDGSTRDTFDNRALTLRDEAGNLLLAAEVAQPERLLQPADLAPYTVTVNQRIIGCQHDECGKRLFFTTTFSGGSTPVELNPGKSAQLVDRGATYRFLNIANHGYVTTHCNLKAVAPFAILREKASGP